MRNKNIIIGCGRLGASIANYEASLGGDVIVIDSNGESFDRLDELFSGYTIVADATDVDELEEVGIANAKQVVITTGDDNVNLFLAHLCAKVYEVPYIYVRFDDPDKGLLIQCMNIKAIYPFQLSKDRFNLLRMGVDK